MGNDKQFREDWRGYSGEAVCAVNISQWSIFRIFKINFFMKNIVLSIVQCSTIRIFQYKILPRNTDLINYFPVFNF